MIDQLSRLSAAEARQKARARLHINPGADMYLYFFLVVSLGLDLAFFLYGLSVGAAIPMTQGWRPFTGWADLIGGICVASLFVSLFRWIIAPNPVGIPATDPPTEVGPDHD